MTQIENLPINAHNALSFFEGLGHQAIDRATKLATSIHSDYQGAIQSNSPFQQLKFAGKVVLVPVGFTQTKSITGLAKQALILDGFSRVQNMGLQPSNETNSAVANQALDGFIRTGKALGNNFIIAGKQAIEETVSELILKEDLTQSEYAANSAALIGTGLVILPFAFQSLKNAFIAFEVASLGYELYQHKDALLDLPVAQSVSSLSQDQVVTFCNEKAASAEANFKNAKEYASTLSTEDKIIHAAVSLATVVVAGYVASYAPGALSSISTSGQTIWNVGKNLGRAYLAFRGAEMLFNSDENTNRRTTS